MRYRENTPLVLNELNLNIESGQTVGIVGRTGSGEDKLCFCFFLAVFFESALNVLGHSRERSVLCSIDCNFPSNVFAVN